MYAIAIYYLLLVAVPEWTAAHLDPIILKVWGWLAAQASRLPWMA